MDPRKSEKGQIPEPAVQAGCKSCLAVQVGLRDHIVVVQVQGSGHAGHVQGHSEPGAQSAGAHYHETARGRGVRATPLPG